MTNVLSFKNPTILSLVGTRERRHAERVFDHGQPSVKLLPVIALFGQNGSGKSNLYRGLRFLQRLLLKQPANPDEHIAVPFFRLDEGESESMPMKLAVDILPAETTYRLRVEIDREGIVAEWLEELRGERVLPVYGRTRYTSGRFQWNIGPLQRRCATADDREFVAFKTRDTWSNQLFLSVLRGKGIGVIDEVTTWFTDQLALMVPDSTLKLLEFKLPTNQGLLEFCNEALRLSGTGIHALQPEEIAWADFPASEETKEELGKKLAEGQGTFVRAPDGRRFSVTRSAGRLVVHRLFTVHQSRGGRLVRFELSSESEGAQRLLDLLPAFFELVQSGRRRIFFIDELARGLHSLLARHLLQSFLARLEPGARRQLIFTTHDVTLLDQDLLRRDEIGFVERNQYGESVLLPLATVAGVRYDKDIRKAYLVGEFGAVPCFPGPLFPSSLPDAGRPGDEQPPKA
jgi:hypothetical protein